MVVNYLNSTRAISCPYKTDAPLIVNANAVLPFSIVFQCFEPIGRRNSQVIQHLRFVQHEQFSQSDLLNFARQFTRHLALRMSL